MYALFELPVPQLHSSGIVSLKETGFRVSTRALARSRHGFMWSGLGLEFEKMGHPNIDTKIVGKVTSGRAGA